MLNKIKVFFMDKPGWSIMIAIFAFILIWISITGKSPLSFLEGSDTFTWIMVIFFGILFLLILYGSIRAIINMFK